jgi:ABC-2 type transport system permease protein
MISRYSVMLGAKLFIICITMTQNLIIILCSFQFFNFYLSYSIVSYMLLVLLLVTSSIGSFSLSLAFILPGHIEFLALILVINLPMLFASTALAPIYFMPYWLQIIAKLNPLTYAIEAVRLIVFNHGYYCRPYVTQVFNDTLNTFNIVKLLAVSTWISFVGASMIVSRKIE